jgi:hypothetical protein
MTMPWTLVLTLWMGGSQPYELKVGWFVSEFMCLEAGMALSHKLVGSDLAIEAVAFECVDRSAPA